MAPFKGGAFVLEVEDRAMAGKNCRRVRAPDMFHYMRFKKLSAMMVMLMVAMMDPGGDDLR
eukprot:3243914-Pyramimonas_sp.AAC.1